MATVVALSMVAGASRLVPGIPAFFMPHKWTGVVVHDEARAALEQIGGTAAPRVATPWPIHALEGGRSVERRVGKECVRTVRTRWRPDHIKTKTTTVTKQW